MARITLRNLAHSYLPHPVSDADYALKQMDHVWEDGGAYALLGSSGCGKTTLLKCLSGTQPVSGGTITFRGETLTGVPAHRRPARGLTQSPEGRQIFTNLTVEENLRYFATVVGVRRRDLDAEALAAGFAACAAS